MAKRTTDKQRSSRLGATLALLALVWATPLGRAVDVGTVTLAWDPSAGPDVAGYRIYYVMDGQASIQVEDVGEATTASIGDLVVGATYSFHATCYNLAGLESDPSNTVTYAVPPLWEVNQPPVAEALELSTPHNTPLAFTLIGTDPDDDILTFEVLTQPEHGALTGLAPDLTYTPATDFAGLDSFTFRVHDGQVESDPATVSIVVQPDSDPPEPEPATRIIRTVAQDDGIAITWISVVDASYRVMRKASLSDPEWTVLSDVIVATDLETTYLDPAVKAPAVLHRYYAVTRILP